MDGVNSDVSSRVPVFRYMISGCDGKAEYIGEPQVPQKKRSTGAPLSVAVSTKTFGSPVNLKSDFLIPASVENAEPACFWQFLQWHIASINEVSGI